VDKFDCVVLAGGIGQRFGSKKQLLEIDGKPLWRIVTEKALRVCNKVVVVGVDVPAGRTRQHSVYNGITHDSLFYQCGRVVILEAARPFVTEEQIEIIGKERHTSCTYYMPSVETVIYNGEYLNRKNCVLLQTPQAFNWEPLYLAHETFHNQPDSTDDTQLMFKKWGTEPHFLEGGPNLHKVTYKEDWEQLKCLQL